MVKDTGGYTHHDAHSAERARGQRFLRIMLSLIGMVPIGIGLLSLYTGHYYGRSNLLGGAEVSLNGSAASNMGWMMILFGISPLAVWFTNKRVMGAWAAACLVAAIWMFINVLLTQ